MYRLGMRILMVLIGIGVFLVYAAGAVVVYLGLASIWSDPVTRRTALVLVLVLTVFFGLLSYLFGTRQLLVGLDAIEIERSRAPWLYDRLDRLCGRMDIDDPAVYVAPLEGPNALAIGGVRSGALVLDPSLFRILDADELEAILAHELAHLESWDGLIQTLSYSCLRTVVGLLTLALLPALLLVSGIARAAAWVLSDPDAWPATGVRRLYRWIGHAVSVVFVALTLVIRAHSRRREFAADDRAAAVTGTPRALASALVRIEAASDHYQSIRSPLYVVNESEDPLVQWFSTHPPVEERIERLRRRGARDSSRRSRRLRRAR